jgi:hypothetical protein
MNLSARINPGDARANKHADRNEANRNNARRQSHQILKKTISNLSSTERDARVNSRFVWCSMSTTTNHRAIYVEPAALTRSSRFLIVLFASAMVCARNVSRAEASS